eukprot:gnl/Ergobibamus_cyprinoides/4135.p1 GENE.gnl/Ergobibamus_cyprinoides/4135~~gnl/Ergobibamus_cyprinoides/4135.p1  ORF type:complete len:204 (+),score=24.13 gnl/Ergobibamus_cyprinoides/4135:217-828(+)
MFWAARVLQWLMQQVCPRQYCPGNLKNSAVLGIGHLQLWSVNLECLVSTGHQPVLITSLPFVHTAIAGRYVPGTFTNRINPHFMEPRMIICNDSREDKQAVLQAAGIDVPEHYVHPTSAPLADLPKHLVKGKKYVCKAVITGCTHKTDIGAVSFNATTETCQAAFTDFVEKFGDGKHGPLEETAALGDPRGPHAQRCRRPRRC